MQGPFTGSARFLVHFLSLQTLLLRRPSFTGLEACSGHVHGDVVAPGISVENCIPQNFLSTYLPKLTSDELTVHQVIALNVVKYVGSLKWSVKKTKSYISDGTPLCHVFSGE